MAQEVLVLDSSPVNYATNVKTDKPIEVTFDSDLDARHLNEYVYLTDSRGVRIEGEILYRRRKLTFTPKAPLEAGKSYQFFLIGDVDLTDNITTGIRNILGHPLKGNVLINFTTEGKATLSVPTIVSPTPDSITRINQPRFEWQAIDNADFYEIRISTSNLFDVLVYPTTENHKVVETFVVPDVILPDGLYYWSVRAMTNEGVASNWSYPYQLSVKTFIEGVIAPEDAPPIEVLYEEADDFELELIEAFPEDDTSVSVKTKSLYFRVLGTVDVSLLDAESLQLIGRNVTGDVDADSHGIVSGRISVVVDRDGTTYIIFTPDILPDPTA